MPTARVNDIEMYYELRGDGPPLVLILGLGGDISEVLGIIDGLAAGCRVLAFDNRGAGRTDKPREPYTIEMMADDTVGLMRHVGLAKAHVLGISLGGRVAMDMALRYPDVVDRLVLVSTAPRVRKTLRRRLIMGLVSRASPKGTYPQPRYAFENQLAASSAYDCTARLPDIAARTFIMHGRKDKTAPYDLAEEMAATIPNATMTTFNGGHLFIFMSERTRFLTEATNFLS